MKDELYLLPTDFAYYHFRCVWPGMPKLPKITSLLFLCNIFKKIEWWSCTQISMKDYYKLIVWFWWGWSSIPKVPKILSLQCLYNISEKKLKMKLIFCMQKNEVDFLHAEKHQSVLKFYFNTLGIKVSYKIDIIISNGLDQAFSNYSK